MKFTVLLFLVLKIVKVFCSTPFDSLFIEYKDKKEEKGLILENIIKIRMLEPFTYDQNISRFESLSKAMSSATDISLKDIKIAIFDKYCDIQKFSCIEELRRNASGLLTKKQRVCLFGGILSTLNEMEYLKQKYFMYSIPDQYIMIFLNTIKVLKQDENFLLAGIVGFAEFCTSNDTIELLASIIFEEVERLQTPLPTFITWIRLRDTLAFDEIITKAYKKHIGGNSKLFPAWSIAKIIVNGPVSEKSTKILLFLVLNNEILNIYRQSPLQCHMLSFRISTAKKFDQFIALFDKFTQDSYLFLEMRAKMVLNQKNFEIITRMIETNMLNLSYFEVLNQANFIKDHLSVYSQYFSNMPPLAVPFTIKILESISNILESIDIIQDSRMKKALVKAFFALLSLVSSRKDFYNETKLSFEPVVKFLLDPQTDANEFVELGVNEIKFLICSPYSQVSLESLSKFRLILEKFNISILSNFHNIAVEFILSNSLNAGSYIKQFKLIHQYLMQYREQANGLAEFLIASLPAVLDPIFSLELLKYFRDNQLISKSSIILSKRMIEYIKTIQ